MQLEISVYLLYSVIIGGRNSLFRITVPEDHRVRKTYFLIHALLQEEEAGRAGARESVTMSVTRSRLRGCGLFVILSTQSHPTVTRHYAYALTAAPSCLFRNVPISTPTNSAGDPAQVVRALCLQIQGAHAP